MNTHDYDSMEDFGEEYFFAELFNEIPVEIISDEYFDRNNLLLSEISDQLYDLHKRTGKLPPELARRIIEVVFSSIRRYGIR